MVQADADGKNGKISGILDFGDMVFGITAAECAIALAYIMFNKKDPIEAGIWLLKSYHKEYPLERREVELMPNLVIARLCQSVLSSAYSSAQDPDNAYISVSEKDAWVLLEYLLSRPMHHIRARFLLACGFQPDEDPQASELLAHRHDNISQALSYQNLYIHRGIGTHLYADNGDRYLDLVNNVCHLGHCDARVVKALKTQISSLNTNTRYLHPAILKYT